MIRKILILFLISILFNFSILLADPDDVVGPKDGSSKSNVKNMIDYETFLSFDFENLSNNQDTQIISGLLPDQQLEMSESSISFVPLEIKQDCDV
jgi:ABC-type oligopeptide transport system substrate-binding subunit